MAAANYQSPEDQFLCSICLDVFNDPVTITCGHNFCKRCINEHWNCTDQHSCPICKKVFNSRPELNINTLLSEMAAQFKQSAQQKTSSCSSSDQAAAKPGEVPCDFCPGPKLKALKSCLVCLVSYCETHLEPHLTVAGLKRHQLMDPVENLESRMCLKHDKLLELFCRTEQTCVCMLCTVLDHKTHDVVPLREEYEEKKAELVKTEAEIQQMIQKRQQKIQETEQSVKLSGTNADREIAESVQVFTALKDSVDRSLNELIKTIKEKQKTTEKQAKESIQKLEQEISELKKRSSVVEQLSQTEDHLHLLQSFPSLDAPQATKDWTDVSVHPSSYEGTVVRAVSQLEETLREEVKKLLDAELKRVQQYAVDVTLDPDTANPYLVLSEDGKRVNPGSVKKNLPDNPERFSLNPCVLGKESFTSGKFYFEVQVKGKTDWDLGVATESINRKEDVPLSPENGYWAIWLRKRMRYKALSSPSVCLFLRSKPQKVGVFVDYEEGLVSFFDVDTAALIYSFTGCSFTEKLYPYFCPCNNDGDCVHPSSYEGTVVRAVSQLEETLREEVKKLLDAELKRVQQYAVDVTLDSDEDTLEDHQKGFSFAKHFISRPRYCPKKSIATGRFYFEAEVKGKTKWTLGVIKHSVTEDTALSPEDGCYIWLTNGNEYKALTDPPAHLSLRSQPQKVGVFVDYEEGLVSFFDVDTAALIYSFTGCSFTEKLYPYFSPSKNDSGRKSTPLCSSAPILHPVLQPPRSSFDQEEKIERLVLCDVSRPCTTNPAAKPQYEIPPKLQIKKKIKSKPVKTVIWPTGWADLN